MVSIDLNHDGRIDIVDLVIVASNLGEACWGTAEIERESVGDDSIRLISLKVSFPTIADKHRTFAVVCGTL